MMSKYVFNFKYLSATFRFFASVIHIHPTLSKSQYISVSGHDPRGAILF